jgi:hypothetical protein
MPAEAVPPSDGIGGPVPTVREAIRFHFEGGNPPTGLAHHSTLRAILLEARSETGRDEGGLVVEELKSGSWLGAVAYFILLDQVGKCFRPVGATWPDEPSGVGRALGVWTSLVTREIRALVALRNALLHDFSFWAMNEKIPDYQHVFRLDRHPTRLVQPPSNPWNGDFLQPQGDETIVSLRVLGDTAEGVVRRIVAEASTGGVDIVLPGGHEELFNRYQMWYALPGSLPA